MRCEFCGHENRPGVKFCSRCGSQFPYAPEDETYDSGDGIKSVLSGITGMLKSAPIKKILMFGIPAAVVIIGAIIAVSMLIGPGVAVRKDSISLFSDRNQIFVSSNKNKFTIDGKYDSIQRSLDHSKAVVLTDTRGASGGTLWFVSTSGSYMIAEDVVAYQIADSGNGVVYLTDHDSLNDIATLYLYDTSARKQTKITEEALFDDYGGMQGICISPNGKTTAYISDYHVSDREFSGYIKVDGRDPERLGKNTFAVAVSDGGRHLYYIKMTDNGRSASLHARSGRNDGRLATDMSGISLILNIDYSQVIFSLDGKSYISRNGGERVRIGGSTVLGFILPRGAQSGRSSANTTVYGVRSFANNVIRNEDGLAYMDSNYETGRISSTSDYAARAFISDDGRTLLYINNNGHLSAIDPTSPGAERREISKDVQQFVATNNCKTIYYINNYDELWCIKGTGTPVKVSDDVYREYLVMPFGTSRALFLIDYSTRRGSGELFYSNNGGRRMKVSGGDDVTRVWVTVTSAFFRTIENDVFRSGGDEKFIKFAENVS